MSRAMSIVLIAVLVLSTPWIATPALARGNGESTASRTAEIAADLLRMIRLDATGPPAPNGPPPPLTTSPPPPLANASPPPLTGFPPPAMNTPSPPLTSASPPPIVNASPPPAASASPPPPAGPPPPRPPPPPSPPYVNVTVLPGCAWKFKGTTLKFQGCTRLDGDFYLNWNYSGGVNVTVGFEAAHYGWIALGLAPKNTMIGSTVVAGYPFQGSVMADTYAVPSKNGSKVMPPGPDLRVIAGPETEYADFLMKIYFTFQLANASQAKNPPLIWGKGTKRDDNGLRLSQHANSNRYIGTTDLTVLATTTPTKGAAADGFGDALHVVILAVTLVFVML